MEDFQLQELQYKYKVNKSIPELGRITCSADIARIVRRFYDDSIAYQESLKLVLLSRSNKIIGIKTVSVGGMTGTVADPKIIFGMALKGLACSVLIVHNHPSGNVKPSQADIALTKKVKEGGQLLELPLLDHVILSGTDHTKYFSFADEGIL
ncbi:JAB domain-containing protein [Flammeovirga yaeyamensis]|uniref:JAB domain-containing protein n=1 Tax=Flammeovirga yaeyamensis TaxID=367791 RepID=A0AAX1NAS4_9BACT|nr:JAB domain-containing protein [Flammeovirga yaeyamensis]MBB3700041.1 DNA repair protein RadC [Flammeovirga yaeyamensis]NMF37522.1 JAB domain-containing protein [Flammeovirga yaeyamensis]QWG04579.1 JAB domain-containing protein [Flammeovirga yaeyamensis]